MVRFLPPEPNLEHLKNEAKALHKAHRQREPGVCDVLRHVQRFRDATDETILSADVPLTEVQFALAMDYGFGSWPELRSTVVRFNPSPDHIADAAGNALLLPDRPGGIEWPDRYAAAFSMALAYLEAPVNYETISGDSGLAFILQADAFHKPFGADIKNLDIGWWPLDEWGATLRLDFLSKVSGVPIRRLAHVAAELEADPARHYREYDEAEITEALQAGRPAIVAAGMEIGVVFGVDGGSPPLLIQPSCTAEPKITRATHYPRVAFVLDPPSRAIDREQADLDAVEFAVRLGRDEVDLSHLPGKSSGRCSWQLWTAQLADPELCGPHFYHANVVNLLRIHRSTAASYLRTMSQRHPGAAADALQDAASTYDTVVKRLETADTSEDQLSTAAGRDRLISLIDAMASLETNAQKHMADALASMR